MATLTLVNPRLVSGSTRTETAAATIAAGQVVATDADGSLILADNNSADTYKCVGIAISPADSGDLCVYAVSGAIMQFSNMANSTYGTNWWVSGTGGAIEEYADISDGEYMFNIARAWQYETQVKLVFTDLDLVKGTIPSEP
jgi:hypothetical protein